MSIRNRVVTSPKQGWLQDQFQIRDIKQPLQGHHQLVMQGTARKKSRKKIKKAQRVEVKELLYTNLTKVCSRMYLTSDWSILTDFVSTRALMAQMRCAIWSRSEIFITSDVVFKSVINNKMKDFPK